MKERKVIKISFFKISLFITAYGIILIGLIKLKESLIRIYPLAQYPPIFGREKYHASFLLQQSVYRPEMLFRDEDEDKKAPLESNIRNKKYRIAIIIPYLNSAERSKDKKSNALPPFFNAFAASALGSQSLVDFLIFHNGLDEAFIPKHHPNVIFIDLNSTANMANMFLQVIPEKERRTKQVEDMLTQVLNKYPYFLVEFKPAYGHIYQEYLTEYTHWGYSDLDVLFGDLPRWITNHELEEYDIVTYGYGDQERLYLRGQFTFHQNNDKTSKLFRPCSYLTEMDVRFKNMLEGKQEFKLESAEGCYSQAVLKRFDVKIKYAVKAWNDVIVDGNRVYSHGVHMGFGKQNKDAIVIYTTNKPYSDPPKLKQGKHWFETDAIYQDRQKPLQWEVGKKEIIHTARNKGKNNVQCMYWAPKHYQPDLCLDDKVSPTDTILYLDGKIYKQKYETVPFANGNVMSFPFFHFQEWKRKYRNDQLSLFRANKKLLDGIILTKEGNIPLYDGKTPTRTDEEMEDYVADVLQSRAKYFSKTYCLESYDREFPAQPPASECNNFFTWLSEEIEFIFQGSEWEENESDILLDNHVSLVLTLSLTSTQANSGSQLNGYLSIISKNIRAWVGQPVVVLLHVSNASSEAKSKIKHHFNGPSTQYHPGSVIVAIYSTRKEEGHVSRNALLNIAQDAARTRFVLMGLEVERGLILSREASYFAKRTILIHAEKETGFVFLVPQFSSKEFFGSYIDGIFSVKDILEVQNKLRSTRMIELDCESCPIRTSKDGKVINFMSSKENQDIDRNIVDAWLHLSSTEVNGENLDLKDLSSQYQEIQHSFIQLASPKKRHHLRDFDKHIILLKDKIGPKLNMLTADVVPYIEELGGRRCYNALHLLQLIMFGYKFQVLPGAAAISYPSSREASCCSDEMKKGKDEAVVEGTYRCDGCFFYDNDAILDNILEDEIKRPAKATLLMNDLIE